MGYRALRAQVTLCLITLGVVAATACASSEAFRGTELEPVRPAAGFELTSHRSQPASLSDFRGRVVLLTFLYTNCPDICPVVANHVRDTSQKLGDVLEEIAVVAVSVDSERDTIDAAREYSERWGMLDRWHYLIGKEDELRPVWSAYYLDPVVAAEEDTEQDVTGPEDLADGVDALYRDIDLRYTVAHSAPVYLIDRDGMLRVLFTLPMDPDDIAHDVRLLLE